MPYRIDWTLYTSEGPAVGSAETETKEEAVAVMGDSILGKFPEQEPFVRQTSQGLLEYPDQDDPVIVRGKSVAITLTRMNPL